jgi:hypothetical protein
MWADRDTAHGLLPSLVATTLIVVAAVYGGPPDAVAQASRDAGAAQVAPTFAAGWSSLGYSRGADRYYDGVAARVGLHALSYFAGTLSAERWPNLERFASGPGGWSLHLEGAFYPLGVRWISPYLLFAVGHFAELTPEDATRAAPSGRSTGFGLGLHANVWRGFGFRVEYLIRQDDGAGDEGGRVFLSYAPVAPPSHGGARISGVIYAMKPVRGVWHFVEPGYGLRTLSPLTENDDIALDVAVFHWEAVDLDYPFSYSWDTRAVLLMPGWQRTHFLGRIVAYSRIGLAASNMIEGPDDGLVPGAHAQMGALVELGPIVVETAIGWLWLSRDARGTIPGTDQHAILVSGGLGF